MSKFVAIDLETGGLEPRVHPITEVGIVTEVNGVVVETGFSLPFDPEACQPKALEIQKYGQRKRPAEWTHSYASEYLHHLTKDAYIVGKNPWFDTSFLDVYLVDWGHLPSWHHRLIDVGALAWGYWQRMQATSTEDAVFISEPPNLDRVAQILGISLDNGQRHGAQYDARIAWDIFRRIVPQ